MAFSLAVLYGGAEIALRLGGGWAEERARRMTGEPDPTAFTILCAGDSHTFGIGAEPERSYPARLQALLAERGHQRVRVVNVGRPGWNSSQVRRALPAALARFHPRVVLLLAGENDRWNLTDAVFDEAAAEAAKALASAEGRAGEVGGADAEPGFLSRADAFLQHSRVYKTLRYLASRVADDRPDTPARAAPAEAVGPPDRTPPALQSLLNSPVDDAWGDARPDDPAVNARCELEMEGFRRAMERGAAREALEHLERFALFLGREPPGLRALLADCHLMLGDPAAAEALLAALEVERPEVAGYASRRAIALWQLHRDDDARSALRRYFAHGVLGREAIHLPGYARDLGMEAAVEEYRSRAAERYPPDLVAAFFDDQRLLAPGGGWDAAAGDPASSNEVLDRWDRMRLVNDRAMVALCRRAGARPVLLTYPRRPDRPGLAVERARLGAEVIDLASVFATKVPRAERARYFVADGHCSARGYALFAETLADELPRLGLLPPNNPAD